MKTAGAILLLLAGLVLGWWLAPSSETADRPVTEPPSRYETDASPASVGPRTPPDDSREVTPVDRYDSQIEQMQAELDGLRARVAALESHVDGGRDESGTGSGEPGAVEQFQPTLQRSSRDRIRKLTDAGLPASTAEYIDSKLQEYELQRLYLRDRAVREGWFGTTRYTDSVRELQGGDQDLRNSLDENDYDLYLYATGQPNRLVVGSVMPGSAGLEAGFQSNDVIYRYAGERVFNTAELRERTAAGIAGETVAVEILRGQDLLLLYLPRGPIGVRLNLDRVSPR